MARSVLPAFVLIMCVAMLGAVGVNPAAAQTNPDDPSVTVATTAREDTTLQSDLQRLEHIERVQAELQTEIAAIRKRIAERSGETAPRVAHQPESRTPAPPAEMPSGKSSVEDPKVARLPELAPVEEQRWHFFVGGELLYVQPRWTTNPAFTERNIVTTPSFSDSAVQKNFDHDFNASPVITAGIVGPNGLGMRGRYWWMDSDASAQAFVPAGGIFGRSLLTAFPLGLGMTAGGQNADQTFTFRNSLRVQTADAELTWMHALGQASILLSGGARYANIRQGYDVDDVLVFQGTPFTNSLRSSHRFEGFGPTLSADLTYPLGWCGFSLYANGRGSVIFGDDREVATLFSVDRRELSQDVAMSIAELEGGVGWSHSFDRFGVELRAGVVGQMWFSAGNGANNENILPNTNLFPGPRDQSLDSNANLGLIGFQFSSGITF